ncbi:hypothetical protein [Aureispira anguillae]|uniref:Uncharacterized protein n=1 Tax=Aureispira anguillae TaxID=2864201 RepID=A0A915YC27_9BACT|nr:hypothetical protein [Aureispira anguillae]BDS10325.1 hypothetical protein AsAng_0010330 [Aureispira anguillae]
MNTVNHYKEKFWGYSNDQLKDIIAGRFEEPSDNEVAAAMFLLKERKNASDDSSLSLAQIPSASMAVLLEIVKNPATWGTDAVAIAEAEILRREHQPVEGSASEGKKTILQIVLTIVGVILSVLLLKMLAGILLVCFLFYCAMSCLQSL